MQAREFWLPQTPLRGKTVHIWRISLAANLASAETLAMILSDEERARAGQFKFERDQHRFIRAHAALRVILGDYLGCTAGQVPIQTAEQGKPSLTETSGLYFNLTHSHELALIAVTSETEIGVDVEYHRTIADIDRLAESCFSEREIQAFRSLPESKRQQAFFDGWTRKEAYIKALGLGLACPLAAFSVALTSGQAALLDVAGKPDEAGQWTLRSIDVAPDYSAAYALRSTGITGQGIDFSLDGEVVYGSQPAR